MDNHTQNDLSDLIFTNRSLFFFEKTLKNAQELKTRLEYFGYKILPFADFEQLKQALNYLHPECIIIEISDTDNPAQEFAAVNDLLHNFSSPPPVIFIASQDSFTMRLEAAQAGGQSFLKIPFDTIQLIEILDRITMNETPPPHRILIIEDEPVQSAIISSHLTKAGLDVKVVNNPLDTLTTLFDFNPDLIIMDLNMPGCSGYDLIRVIRQIEAFISLPVIYLSAEDDQDRQMKAISLGGDDFLSKPMKPEHLISIVNAKVERYRTLRQLMTNDSLTGLLNHVTLKERLRHELLRTQRDQTPLSYATLVIDQHKSISDRYGRATGDHIIENLARMLKQQLRRTDLIGRYSGEEFAFIFPNTPLQSAVRVMNNLRVRFNKIPHQTPDKIITCTFSCGIAAFPYFDTPASLSAAADKALYIAKNNGRNQVVSTPPYDML